MRNNGPEPLEPVDIRPTASGSGGGNSAAVANVELLIMTTDEELALIHADGVDCPGRRPCPRAVPAARPDAVRAVNEQRNSTAQWRAAHTAQHSCAEAPDRRSGRRKLVPSAAPEPSPRSTGGDRRAVRIADVDTVVMTQRPMVRPSDVPVVTLLGCAFADLLDARTRRRPRHRPRCSHRAGQPRSPFGTQPRPSYCLIDCASTSDADPGHRGETPDEMRSHDNRNGFDREDEEN